MSETATAPELTELKARKYTTRTIGDKESEQIVALNNGGFYLAEIVEVTGRTAKQIETVLWNEGHTPRTHKYEQKEVQKWVSMYSGEFDGRPMGFAHIARCTGYSVGTIQLAVLRAGVRDRHPAESRRLSWERRKAEVKH